MKKNHGGARLKRVIDLVGVTTVGIVLSPVLAGIALTIAITSGRPILFRQERPGLHGRPFVLYKFRTMEVSQGPDGTVRPDEERLSRLGKALRRMSLDELPELFNVLKGDMSLVGPRPLLLEYLPLYSSEQARRHEVKPGITGLAQVSGRNELPWHERFALDVWYVDHHSIALDLKILLMTVAKVTKMEGISGGGRATMEPFRGSAY